MSDRYQQLDLVEYLETKVESAMYPNFAVGDIVSYEAITGYLKCETRQGKIIEILDTDWFRVDCLNGTQFSCSSVVITKVRVHQTGNLTDEDTNLDHKSPSIHYEIKEIKGRFYKYARWWEGDRHKSKYIGRA